MTSNYFSLHTHSRYSVLDGMTSVESLVETAVALGQPALALTDHGNLAGAVRLYKACKAAGIKPFIGMEAYIIDPLLDTSDLESMDKVDRFHLGIIAFTTRGYQGLVKFSSLTHTRPRYSRFPRATFDDLLEFLNNYGDDVLITTGCVFGLIQGTLIRDGYDAALSLLTILSKHAPHLYVEIQKHGIDDQQGYTENELAEMMVHMADQLDLPTVVTPDNHYTHQYQSDAHSLMKRMVYGGTEDAFPGDTYHLPSAEFMEEKFDEDIWARAEESFGDILAMHDLVIPALDDFVPQIPVVHPDADSEVRRLAYDALRVLPEYKHDKDTYDARVEKELDIFKKVGVSNYFLFTKLGVDYCKANDIPIEARGSANGSLVCFLLGLTSVDAVKHNTLIERFISEDRVGSMPDIDMDIATSRRPEIIVRYNNTVVNGVKYTTTQIGTMSMLGQSSEEDGTGSVFRTYITYLRNKMMADCEKVEPVKSKAKVLFNEMWSKSTDSLIKTLNDVRKYHPQDYKGLKTIIEMGTVGKSYGVHPGGILVSADAVKIEDWIPTMLIASSDTTVSQFDMKDVEAFGLMKMDWLGQTSLDVMTDCQRLMGRKDPSDFSWIPDHDMATATAVKQKAFHTGIFHVEGSAKSKGTMKIKPEQVEDYIHIDALFMPGAMESGATDTFVNRRKNPSLMSSVPYTHKLLEDTFDWTNGVMIYQDQVLQIGKGIGMTPEQLTTFFKVIKDSGKGAVEKNAKRLDEQRPLFYTLSEKAGFTKTEQDWVWNQMVAMGSYAFNLAHATGYGLRSYRSAYLKTHHTAEYMTALLRNWATSGAKVYGKPKIDIYLEEARRLGLTPRSPKINVSQDNYSLDLTGAKPVIRKGFSSIKGLGAQAAEELMIHQPYTSIDDIIEKCNARKVTGGKSWAKKKTLNGVLKLLQDLDVLEF